MKTCDNCKNQNDCAKNANTNLTDFLKISHNFNWAEYDCYDYEMKGESD